MSAMNQAMKKWGSAAAMALLLLTASLPALRAETQVNGTTIAVTATVIGVNNLITTVKNISNQASTTSITFGAVASPAAVWNNRAQQFVDISVEDNALSWRLRLYSNNFGSAPSTTTWAFQYGGLIGNVAGAKAPGAWSVLPDTGVVQFGGPGAGNPATGTVNGWTFMKDLHDADDPSTVGNESFAAADATGYDNIAFGSPSFTRIIRPNVVGGSDALSATFSHFYLFLESDFSSSPAASYSTNLVLDLLNS